MFGDNNNVDQTHSIVFLLLLQESLYSTILKLGLIVLSIRLKLHCTLLEKPIGSIPTLRTVQSPSFKTKCSPPPPPQLTKRYYRFFVSQSLQALLLFGVHVRVVTATAKRIVGCILEHPPFLDHRRIVVVVDVVVTAAAADGRLFSSG